MLPASGRLTGLKRLARRGLPLLALTVIWLLFFWRFAAPNPADRLTYVPGDFSETFGLFRDLTYRALAAGHWPLWSDCLWSGYPLHADPQAQVFYPPAWITAVVLRLQGYGNFPLEALVAEAALHYLATSFGLFLFLRSRQLRPAAAVLGAVTFTYGGYLTGYPPLQTAVLEVNAWTPLALWLAGRLAEHRRPRDLALTALALAGAFLAGHPQTFLFAALITLAYFTFRFFMAGPRPPAARFAALAAGLILLTTGLVAVQLLPALQFVADSTRASVPFDQAAHGFPFQDLAQLVVAGIASVWSPLYVGLLPLALAVYALTRRQAEVRFWAGAALVSLVLSFGTPAAAYDVAYWSIPGLALFRGAERLALIFSLALAVLAAFGAQAALAALSRVERRLLERIARGAAGLWLAGLGALMVVMLPASADLGHFAWGSLPGLLGRFGLMLGLTVAVLAARLRLPFLRRWTPALMVLVAVLDLFAANRPLNVTAPYQAYPPNALVLPIQAEAGFFRVQDDDRLPGHAGCAYGFRETAGVTPYHLAAYDQLLAAPEPVRWALLGVRYVVTWRADLFDAHGARIPAEVVAQNDVLDAKGNPTRTQRLAQAPRRAWWAGVVETLKETQIAARLAEPGFDPFASVVLAAPGLGAPVAAAPSSGVVTVLGDQPGQIQLQSEAAAPGVLVVSEPYFPGWEAQLDGQAAPVLRADGALLAVATPAGRHRLQLSYTPPLLRWAGLISLSSLLLCLWLILAPRTFLVRKPIRPR